MTVKGHGKEWLCKGNPVLLLDRTQLLNVLGFAGKGYLAIVAEEPFCSFLVLVDANVLQ